ncbi:MAG: DUF6279 family lipoprotein, partial [Pseudomonadales bacterium]|nr:DUF6279 family lipoprotein [Pseudomonadales bacterium]
MPGACSRLLVLFLLLPVLSGCSVRFVYNNADRLAVWQAGEYLDLDRAQRDWFRARMRLFLHWHRTNQLPRWSAALRDFELAVQDDVRREDFEALVFAGEQWADEIVMEILPTTAELLASLSDAQVAALPEAFAKRNAELNEDYAGLPEAEQKAVWRREMREGLDRWVGDLNAGQELLLDAASERVVADNGSWIGYRERWQAELMAALARRGDAAALEATLRSLMLDRERWYTEDYARTRAINDGVYRDFTVALLASLDGR